jgi:hypothetical protein
MLIGVVRLEAESLSLLTAQRVRSVRPDVEPHEEQMRAVADQPPDIACLRRKLSEVSCSAPAAVLSPVAGPAAAPTGQIRTVGYGGQTAGAQTRYARCTLGKAVQLRSAHRYGSRPNRLMFTVSFLRRDNGRVSMNRVGTKDRGTPSPRRRWR